MANRKGLIKTKLSQYSVEPSFQKFLKDTEFLERSLEMIELKRGSSVKFRRGGQEGFYFLISGLTKIEICNPEPRVLRLCLPGDLAGIGFCMSGALEKYLITALHPSIVQFWPRRTFEELRSQRKELNELVIENLCKTVLHKDERISALVGLSVLGRVSNLIVWLANNFGKKTDSGVLIDVELDRDSMSQLAGTIPQTLSRMLSQLEDDNLIKRRRRKIIVQDLSELAKKA